MAHVPGRRHLGGVSTAFNVDRLVAEVAHLDPDMPFQPEVGTPIDDNQHGLTDIFMHDLQGRWSNWHVLLAEREGNFTRLDTEVARMYPLLSAWTPGSTKTPTHSAHLADVDDDGVSDLIQCGDDGISMAWWVHLWRPSGPEGPGFEPTPGPIPALYAYPCNADLHTRLLSTRTRASMPGMLSTPSRLARQRRTQRVVRVGRGTPRPAAPSCR